MSIWWGSDRAPRGIKQKEWSKALMYQQLGAVISFFGFLSTVLWLYMVISSPADSSITVISVADFLASKPSALSNVWLTGTVRTETPLKMPDFDNDVVCGKFSLKVRSKGVKTEYRELTGWSGCAEKILLTQGNKYMDITDYHESFILIPDKNAAATINNEGPTRNRKPVSIEYGNEIFELSDEESDKGISVKLERSFIPNLQQSVLMCGLDSLGQLIPPTDGNIRLYPGTVEQLRSFQKKSSFIMGASSLFIIFGGLVLWRKGKTEQKHLLQNQPRKFR